MPTLSTSGSRVGPCIAVLGTIAITFLVVTTLAWHRARKFEDERHFLKTYRVPHDSEALLAYSADYATNSSEANDVIFIGGSSCLSGLRTKQFGQSTGLGAYNLGVLGMAGIGVYHRLVQIYLEHHPAPRLVVLCVQPSEVGPIRAPKDPALAAMEAYSSGITEQFLWCYGRDGATPRPSRPDPLKSYIKQGLLMGVGCLCGGQRHYLNSPTRELYHYSYYSLKDHVALNRGSFGFGAESRALPAAALRDLPTEPLLPAEDAMAEDPYPVTPEFDAGVRALARTAADKNVLLMIRLAPVLRGAKAEPSARLRTWFDQLESDCPNIICDRPAVLQYGPECFADLSYHCNLRGAEQFTALVASRVTPLLGTSTDHGPTSSVRDRIHLGLEAKVN